jgi:hypothetical protein
MWCGSARAHRKPRGTGAHSRGRRCSVNGYLGGGRVLLREIFGPRASNRKRLFNAVMVYFRDIEIHAGENAEYLRPG